MPRKYLGNLLANPWMLGLLLAGLVLVIVGVLNTARSTKTCGIWFGGLGTVLVGLAVSVTAGYNNTAFYPSKVDLQSSLTIYNASSSPYTLTAHDLCGPGHTLCPGLRGLCLVADEPQ